MGFLSTEETKFFAQPKHSDVIATFVWQLTSLVGDVNKLLGVLIS